VVMPLNVLSDSTVVIGVKAVLSGKTAAADHWVNFAVDTTKLTKFVTQYGSALLLPSSSYLFYKSMTKIAAGTSISDSAQINIITETQLKGYTTYVLPLVIQSVDGKVDGPATDEVLYLVFQTGKPATISKDGWTIADSSSSYSKFYTANLLDNDNAATYWTSSLTQQMPQWVTINFNSSVTFSAVNYYIPTALKYPTYGGYPTSIQIETSLNGTTWVSNGIYAGNISNNMQTLNTGLTTAKYLRFTVLASVKYSSTYSCIFISGISLVP